MQISLDKFADTAHSMISSIIKTIISEYNIIDCNFLFLLTDFYDGYDKS